MAAPKGNTYWRLRSKSGKEKKYSTATAIAKKAEEYFEWCENNPLQEATIQKIKINGIGEKIIKEDLPKMRPFTIHGLCVYMEISLQTFNNYEKNEDYVEVITRIKEIIYLQKFEGAAAGFLNPNIIARDLGLIDKKQIDVGKKKEVAELFPEELEPDGKEDQSES